MRPRPMTYADAIRVLLIGVCGANHSEIARASRIGRLEVIRFMNGGELSDRQMTRLGFFVWGRMNAHLLLCETDSYEPHPEDENRGEH